MKKILVVEDDKILNEGIKITLEQPDIEILQAYNLKQTEKQLAENLIDLIILDVNLPDGNGFDLCKKIRFTSNLPILFLTARDGEMDIVKGLEFGGDDYITKPFSLMVLRARVAVVLRRENENNNNKPIFINNLFMDFYNMVFTKDGQKITLSKTEQKLLKLLVINKGNILSREQLMDKVWTDESEFVDENALNMTIKRLRGKLEDNPSKPHYIKNIYGIGYVWTNEVD